MVIIIAIIMGLDVTVDAVGLVSSRSWHWVLARIAASAPGRFTPIAEAGGNSGEVPGLFGFGIFGIENHVGRQACEVAGVVDAGVGGPFRHHFAGVRRCALHELAGCLVCDALESRLLGCLLGGGWFR